MKKTDKKLSMDEMIKADDQAICDNIDDLAEAKIFDSSIS